MPSAADPQKTAQIDPGLRSEPRVERLLGVDESGGFPLAHNVTETRNEVARAAGRRRPDDLGDLAADRNRTLRCRAARTEHARVRSEIVHGQKANHVMSIKQDEDVGGSRRKLY